MIIPLSFHFFLGFVVSFLGTIPPAGINLVTIKIAATKGVRKAIEFAIGAVIIEFFYSYIAILFSNYLTYNKPLTQLIQLIAIPIFLLLSFLYFRQKSAAENNLNEVEESSVKEKNTFVQGLAIGIMNIIQIPFWLAYGTYFISIHWLETDAPYLLVFVAGICCGSFALLTLAAYYSKKWFSEAGWANPKTFNKILAGIFLLLALIQTGKILIWGY